MTMTMMPTITVRGLQYHDNDNDADNDSTWSTMRVRGLQYHVNDNEADDDIMTVTILRTSPGTGPWSAAQPPQCWRRRG